MRKAFVFTAILCFSAPAVAQITQFNLGRALQQNSTTRANQAAAEAMQQQAAAQRAATEAENRRQAIRATVGQLAASGDCVGAVKAAMTAGDFDLAAQVKALCTH